MACMEHECNNPDCGYIVMNNKPRTPPVCPKCGDKMSHFSDELRYWDDREDEDSDEEEE